MRLRFAFVLSPKNENIESGFTFLAYKNAWSAKNWPIRGRGIKVNQNKNTCTRFPEWKSSLFFVFKKNVLSYKMHVLDL